MAHISFSNSEIDLSSLCFQMIHLSPVRGTNRVCCQAAAAGGKRATRLHRCRVAVTENRCSLWLLSGVLIYSVGAETLVIIDMYFVHRLTLYYLKTIVPHEEIWYVKCISLSQLIVHFCWCIIMSTDIKWLSSHDFSYILTCLKCHCVYNVHYLSCHRAGKLIQISKERFAN